MFHLLNRKLLLFLSQPYTATAGSWDQGAKGGHCDFSASI